MERWAILKGSSPLFWDPFKARGLRPTLHFGDAATVLWVFYYWAQKRPNMTSSCPSRHESHSLELLCHRCMPSYVVVLCQTNVILYYMIKLHSLHYIISYYIILYYIILYYIILYYIILYYIILYYIILYYIILYYIILCYVMLCYVMLCYVLFCYIKLCYIVLC